jgi:tRNA A-37 threonylcarbamoyl transferase component Bud32
MHIFEYLGKEVPEEKWNNKKVYRVIKARLEELHLLGISHNDVRPANIHVSVSGKISLIDFGLSDCTNNEEHKENDFETLNSILEVHNSSENDFQESQEIHDESDKYGKYESDRNSSYEEVFDGMSAQSLDTSTTEGGNSSKAPRR